MAEPCPPPKAFANAKDIGELDRVLRDRLYTLMLDAPRRGLVPVSLYRTPWQQYLLRIGRVPRGQECNSRVSARPPTAVPWKSNHQRRKAADIGGRDLPWAGSVARRYGLALTVRGEPWHFEAVGTPTVRIRTYPGRTYDGTARPAPAPTPPKETFDMDSEARAAFAKINQRLTSIERGIVIDEGSDTKVAARDRKYYGSLRGWVAAIAEKVGASPERAAQLDPTKDDR